MTTITTAGVPEERILPKSVYDCAWTVLNTADVFEKARLTRHYVQAWKDQKLTEIYPVDCGPLPDRPARKLPEPPQQPSPAIGKEQQSKKNKNWWNLKVSKKTIKFMHGILHAEGVAIDLMWDLIARFQKTKPMDFYNDWLQVALEEACHFETWAERLQVVSEGSYHYGSLDVHDGLWKAAFDTRHDTDGGLERLVIVHGVHEARGLDTFPIAQERLLHDKDQDSLTLLQHNFQQEITHVAAAVKWIDYLCQEQALDPVETFHKIVQQHYQGKLPRPFNYSARDAAKMDRGWYEPLGK